MRPYYRSVDGRMMTAREEYLRLCGALRVAKTQQERNGLIGALLVVRAKLRQYKRLHRSLGIDPALFNDLPAL